ncbi:hypothetical protein BDA96_04G267900 [Sorghum bicolor]|uniref:Uncharacterized protein n=2 Tax=Sorghum bicolor TaxID=4558 RepID=A0A921R660_SORBI|nr:hypothetical protein BDA96_04G267900 [Sorghum bicolor]KXG30831.1 hypothetical protein SORBI_3004G251400 [Sorghum bicolor]
MYRCCLWRTAHRPFLRLNPYANLCKKKIALGFSIRLRFRARLSKDKTRRDKLCLDLEKAGVEVEPLHRLQAVRARRAGKRSCASTAPRRSREEEVGAKGTCRLPSKASAPRTSRSNSQFRRESGVRRACGCDDDDDDDEAASGIIISSSSSPALVICMGPGSWPGQANQIHAARHPAAGAEL